MPTFWPNVAAVFTTARPSRLCNGNISSPTMNRFFNTSCFAAPPINSFGDAGRNVLTGPGAQSWDMAVAREFPIKERVRLDFRADFFSIFNHENWKDPDTGVLNPNFGQIFGKYDPRVIKFGLKISF